MLWAKNGSWSLLLVLLLSFAACHVYEEETTGTDDGLAHVSFTLAIRPRDVATRAGSETWDPNNYNPQSAEGDYDNFVDLATVQVVLLDAATNAYLGKVGDLLWTRSAENLYVFKGSIDKTANNLTAGTLYKVMVLANAPAVNSGTSLADLQFLLYSANASDNTRYIPLWGVKGNVTLTLDAGKGQDLGTIHMLRSMAKVNVSLTDEVVANGYTLKSVSINRYNKGGHCLPTGWGNVEKTTDLNLDACLNPLATSLQTTAKTFEVKNNSSVFYLAEYQNKGNGAIPASLSVTIEKDGKEYVFSNALEFKKYEDGIAKAENYDVLRNHLYNFKIQGVYGASLKLTCTVKEWNLLETVVDFTDILTVNNYIEWASGTYDSLNTNSAEVTLTKENTPLTCTFSLATPKGAVWYAELITVESAPDNSFPFGFVGEDGNFLTDSNGYPRTTVHGNFGETVTLRIKATHSSTSVTNKAKLHFVLKIGTRTIAISNLVDTSAGSKEYVLIQEIN
ncbi:hypothetical protein [Bacteroides heparinolyticus]|uniref:hypothetical protein n=1 Tax=Prevotella heparinolytica TaxID=28113 RepID=UPI0023F90180|nr:hypothetical protein [Bacteroides heparinolyticus]MCI6212239.1 FimB/Mfa2 family fimbrial subunit [Bacteroides heparinolyticus]